MKDIRSILAVLLIAAIIPSLSGCASLSGCGRSNKSPGTKTIVLSTDGDMNVTLDMVQLPNQVWFGKYEVTHAQWESVNGDKPSGFEGGDNPVECISWDDCQMFLRKLNAMPSVKESGLAFRLPTEEEWEYACRAGATGEYCRLADGTEITESTLDQVAWFDDNSDRKSHPVGRKKPNAFGLHDMNGNICEWTSTEDGEYRVYHGGCWRNSAENCEISNRIRLSPRFRFNDLGFRLCADGKAD